MLGGGVALEQGQQLEWWALRWGSLDGMPGLTCRQAGAGLLTLD
jgi:hypothetical protein